MPDATRLDALHRLLEGRPLTPEVRRGIRRARIAVIDDQIDQLAGMLEGLRAEGFTNLVEIRSVESVNQLVEGDYDLIVLDLIGVAPSLTAGDGVGVLAALKRADPSIPVMVLSGNAITPTLAGDLANADAICAKPMLPVDLAAEIEDLLKQRLDVYWAALAVLREVRRLAPDRADRLGMLERAKLWVTATALARAIEKQKPGTVTRVVKVASIMASVGNNAARLIGIARRLSSSP